MQSRSIVRSVDGKYRVSNYSRSNDFVCLKDEAIAVRLMIKWAYIKPRPSNALLNIPPDAATKPEP